MNGFVVSTVMLPVYEDWPGGKVRFACPNVDHADPPLGWYSNRKLATLTGSVATAVRVMVPVRWSPPPGIVNEGPAPTASWTSVMVGIDVSAFAPPLTSVLFGPSIPPLTADTA